jgi:(p)ppGpp synthase/HD superfamily hydrolase
MLFEAIKFVAEAHSGHYRKGTKVPYISHLLNVMRILAENDCEEDVLIAGLLHDAVEDTSTTLIEIENKFGAKVANIVKGVSESSKLDKTQPKADWKSRKIETLETLKTEANVDILLVACADKLDNARSTLQARQKVGERIWERFNAGKEAQIWYFVSLVEIFASRADEFGEPLFSISSELAETVELLFKED